MQLGLGAGGREDPTCTYTGDQPAPDWWISSPSRPSILGREGPQMSMSSRPTWGGGGWVGGE